MDSIEYNGREPEIIMIFSLMLCYIKEYRMKKRLFAFLTALLFIIQPALLLAQAVSPTDEMDDWAYPEVIEAIDAHLVPASLQNQYRSNITRSQYCNLIVKAVCEMLGTTLDDLVMQRTGVPLLQQVLERPFNDTADDDVTGAYALGLVVGYDDGDEGYSFRPDDLITRQEAAVLIWRVAGLLGMNNESPPVSDYADRGRISDWALTQVDYVSSLGIMVGINENVFSPNARLTRQQSFIMVIRFYNATRLPHESSADDLDPHIWTTICEGLIAHALGGIDGFVGNNSLEALLENYRLGHRVFEVDLNLTTDGELAAVHNWPSYSGPRSSDEWREVRISGRYTAILLQDLLDFMMEHPDMYIVTDTKSFEYSEEDMMTQFRILYERTFERGGLSLVNRIVPQIYNQEMYHSIGEIYRYPSIIYTLYTSPDSDAQVVEFVRDKPDIKVITMGPVRYSQEFHANLAAYDKLIYFFTINDHAEIESYREMGVSGFYTDFVYPESIY